MNLWYVVVYYNLYDPILESRPINLSVFSNICNGDGGKLDMGVWDVISVLATQDVDAVL